MSRAYDSSRVYRIDFSHRPGTEHILDISKAERPARRQLHKRVLVDGRQTYAAYSAHELLDAVDPTHLARPGHPLG